MPHTCLTPARRACGGDASRLGMTDDTSRDDAVAALLAAVAEPNRLRLVRVLLNGDRCVTQCTVATGLSQSSVSKHLIRLIDVGLVARERVGRRNYHRLVDPERVRTLLDAASAAADATAK